MRVSRGAVLGAVAAIAALTATGCGGGGDGGGVTNPPPGGFPTTAAVTATAGNSFSPRTVDIASGGRVSWTFNATHNVTFVTVADVPEDIPDTPSGQVGRRFTAAGRFAYNCTIHPGMSGTVVVH